MHKSPHMLIRRGLLISDTDIIVYCDDKEHASFNNKNYFHVHYKTTCKYRCIKSGNKMLLRECGCGEVKLHFNEHKVNIRRSAYSISYSGISHKIKASLTFGALTANIRAIHNDMLTVYSTWVTLDKVDELFTAAKIEYI